MAGAPMGILCCLHLGRRVGVVWRWSNLQSCRWSNLSFKCALRCRDINSVYRILILSLTFLCYASYHLSRKPISVVKSVLNQNCTSVDLNKTIELNSTTWCDWEPFVGPNSDTLLGSLDYSFLFAYAIGIFFSGYISERVDLRYFLTFGMMMTGVFTALFGFGYYWKIHNLYYYIFVQVMAGLCQSTGWPAVIAVVGNWFGPGSRGLIMGVWNAHTSIGNILGALIAGVWVDTDWGLSFIVPGAVIAGVGLLLFLFLVPSPDMVGCRSPNVINVQTSSVEGEENQSEEEQVPETTSLITNRENRVKEIPITIMGAVRIPGVIEFSLSLFFAKLVSYTFLFWLPNYIGETKPDLSASQSADLSTLFDVGGIVGGILAGVLADHSGSSATVCCVMLIITAPLLYIYNLVGATASSATNVALLMLCGAFVNGPYSLITTAVSADLGTHPSLLGNSKALATVSAIIDGTGSIGAAIGPLMTGIIASNSNWQNVFWMLIGSNMIALVLLLRLLVKELRAKCCRRQSSHR